MSPREAEVYKTLEGIAKENFSVETLETRKSDGLDFHDTAVWCMKKALEEAFQAGFSYAVKNPGSGLPINPNR